MLEGRKIKTRSFYIGAMYHKHIMIVGPICRFFGCMEYTVAVRRAGDIRLPSAWGFVCDIYTAMKQKKMYTGIAGCRVFSFLYSRCDPKCPAFTLSLLPSLPLIVPIDLCLWLHFYFNLFARLWSFQLGHLILRIFFCRCIFISITCIAVGIQQTANL